MSRKLPRLLFVASMVAGASVAPMLDAHAQDTRGIDIENDQFGARGTANAAGETQIYKGDDVVWRVINGEHTVTPEEPEKWDGSQGSPTLKAGDTFTFQFTKADTYAYYCEIHGRGMSGKVVVIDPTATTTTTAPVTTPPPPPPPPPTTTTTRPVVTTTSPPATSAGSKTPTSAAPAPTTTAPKDKGKGKDKPPKEEETTTTTAPPPPPPIDLPNEAIIPSLPGFGTGTTTQDGIEAPEGTPEGDAVALLKSNKRGGGGDAKTLLIVSGLGLGVLGFGTAGYKYANRSSKYFPA